MKKIIFVLLLAGVFCFYSPKDIINAQAQPDFSTLIEYGLVLRKGVTLDLLWGNGNIRPPIDSINTYTIFPNDDELVTKDNQFWFRQTGQKEWTTGTLSSYFGNQTNPPPLEGNYDSCAISPNGSHIIVKGEQYWSLSSGASAWVSGYLANVWTEENHPPTDKIDSQVWLGSKTGIIVKGSEIWLDYSLVDSTKPRWEKSTLATKWQNNELHPPISGIDIYAYSKTRNEHLVIKGNRYWTLGTDQIFDTFQSGFDGYGEREAFIYYEAGTYYLYYDAMEANHNWRTSVATSNSPDGPWKKLGPMEFLGPTRPWEQTSITSSNIFKINNRYYNYYLGSPTYIGTDPLSPTLPPDRYRVPGSLPGEYYSLGLAVSSSPLGPWKKIKGDGTEDAATVNDPPLLPAINNWWYMGTPAASAYLVKNTDNNYYLFFSVYYAPNDANKGYGIGLAAPENNNLLGPYREISIPLKNNGKIIPSKYRSENVSVYYEEESNTWFIFSNAARVSYPTGLWSEFGYCGTEWRTVGVVIYWSKDLFNWDPENQRHLLISADPLNSSSTFKCGDGSWLNESTTHRGRVGMASVIPSPDMKKLYIYFDANDFIESAVTSTPRIGHAFRDIYLASLDLPLIPSLSGDLNNDLSVNIFDLRNFLTNFLQRLTIFDYNKIVENFGL